MGGTPTLWPFHAGRPAIEIRLGLGQPAFQPRRLLADTGAGPVYAPYELLLGEDDCLRFGPAPMGATELGGAFSGRFLVYPVGIVLPLRPEVRWVPAVALRHPRLPAGFDGIASLRFLNRFTYGNFGQPDRFGLQLP
ncbi:MAG: hypothetical protein COZ06_24165 [Armatimonadetes bacterium CG_4_10_14_3_um_filter_66_18]|nr:hypothetical protein [Armatimonadota bacterium]OIO92099.1 MAG: hypothetical protein AUJ96_33005 [Armatimonadetes bacterium CG2_30_66_41]PIU90989.1 MAG: hypothetical protein COS65_23465 [Armatimonadetes bacterium CG06_land_8_20_14_3_00_66_21]PIX46209.1 MAG: hypothetical protein COZ57_13240 [Armatimonadetes bacterium CG_4_8_14_3_um_filter_66_20]PIY42894.1 MAG: hypothetical protein COZ06_24165 [Armatimonadetes bacterium CG_4_10_14_3_um_filter_66_18]PIZ50100.1 MAG: hypothetical protein COY42_02